MNWIKFGDGNTKFFHQSICRRIKTNRISHLHVSGCDITDPALIRREFFLLNSNLFALSIQGGGKLIWILFVLVLFFRTFSKACLILALLKQRSKRLCGVSRMISLLVWMVSIASSTKPPGIFLGRMLHKLSPNSFLMAKFEILEYYKLIDG